MRRIFLANHEEFCIKSVELKKKQDVSKKPIYAVGYKHKLSKITRHSDTELSIWFAVYDTGKFTYSKSLWQLSYLLITSVAENSFLLLKEALFSF